MGASELIFVLLSLSSFGVQPNPNAPAAAEVTKYAPDDADLMIHLDLEAVLAPNWSKVQKLPEVPAIKANAEIAMALQEGIAHLDMMRNMARMQGGVDPVNDLKSATLFIPSLGKENDVVAVFRGNFPVDIVDKAAVQLGGKVSKAGAKSMVAARGGDIAIALVEPGTLIVGSPKQVAARFGAWKGKVTRGAARIPWYDGEKPFLAMSFAPSGGTLKMMKKDAGRGSRDPGKNAVMDGMLGLEAGAFWLRSNGVGWSITSRTPAGHLRAVDFSEGMLSFMRANHHFTRGITRWALAALPSMGKQFAGVAKYRADILKLVEAWTGDGNFPAKVDAQPAKRTVVVTATGQSLAQVLPLGGLMPLGALAWLTVGSRKRVEEPVAMPPSPRGMRPATPKTTADPFRKGGP